MRYLGVITLLVLALALLQPVSAQSIDAGIDASKRGDYATALKHLRPLAKRGVARAPYSLGVVYKRGAAGHASAHTGRPDCYSETASREVHARTFELFSALRS